MNQLPDDLSDPLVEHAEAGWRLGWDCAEQDAAGKEPDLAVLEAAIGHLEAAVLDGIDDFVLREPQLFWMLGHLLLLAASHAGDPAEAAAAVEEAHAVFADGLDCLDDDETLRIALLDGALLACRNRTGLLEPAPDPYHPEPELAYARDAQVAAAQELFQVVPPGHELSGHAATLLIRAFAARLLGRTGPEDDAASLLALVRSRPDVREVEGAEDAGILVLMTCNALSIGYEHDGREDLLLAVTDFVAEAQAWPDLPPRFAPLLALTAASAIANAAEDGELASRLGEALQMLDDAVRALPPDDPHLRQAAVQRAIIVQRLATQSQDPVLMAETAREIDAAMAQQPGGPDGGETTLLASLLGGVLEARFRRRQDLRDARTGLELTERALASSASAGTALQRASLMGNRAIQLMQMAWLAGDPSGVNRALDMLRAAITIAPPASPIACRLQGLLAVSLATRAQAEPVPEQEATLREAWDAVTKAAVQEPPWPPTLVIQISLASALGPADPLIREAGEQAARRLRDVRASLAGREMPTDIVDMAFAMIDGITAMQPGGSRQLLDAALSQIESLSARPGYPDMAGQLLGMQQARVLRYRDDLNWKQALQAFRDQPTSMTPDIPREQVLDWLHRGGRQPSEIGGLMAHGLAGQIRDSSDRRRSREIGVQVLRGHAVRVLLQSGTQDAITAARAASRDSHEVVTWCLADGADDEAIAALEAGRGLTMLAAGAAGSVAGRLAAMGEPELAQAWQRSQDGTGPRPVGSVAVPGDVRHRVLDRLAASGDLADLLGPPDRADLAATLTQLGYDALVYLIPQGRSSAAHMSGGQSAGRAADRPGGALTVTASGRVRWLDLPDLAVGPDSVIGGYLRAHHALLVHGGTPDRRDAWRNALEQACQWAWAAAMEPLSPVLAHIHPARRARVVLVPVDALCVIPWHAAYPAGDQGLPSSERRYAMDAVAFSYAASGALLSRVARRSPPALDSSVLLVGDPGGDLPHARAETQALQAAFYPDATIWGRPPALTDGEATAPRLRNALAGAGHSLFHYAGHATIDVTQPGSSALVLGDQRLRAEQISRLAPGESYCVSLAACTTHLATDAFDEVFTLSTAFLLGGASTVLGSLWRLKDSVGTAVLMFLVHHYLNRGVRPVDALHRAQRWMLDPGRRIPGSMPDQLREALSGVDLTDPVIWAGLTHQGH